MLDGENQDVAIVGRDFDQVPWPTHPTLELAARHYMLEHVKPRGSDAVRAGAALAEWMVALDPQRDIRTLKRDDGRQLIARVLARGCKPATARRILSVGRAALYHEKREERIRDVPVFPEIPAGDVVTPHERARHRTSVH